MLGSGGGENASLNGMSRVILIAKLALSKNLKEMKHQPYLSGKSSKQRK